MMNDMADPIGEEGPEGEEGGIPEEEPHVMSCQPAKREMQFCTVRTHFNFPTSGPR